MCSNQSNVESNDLFAKWLSSTRTAEPHLYLAGVFSNISLSLSSSSRPPGGFPWSKPPPSGIDLDPLAAGERIAALSFCVFLSDLSLYPHSSRTA